VKKNKKNMLRPSNQLAPLPTPSRSQLAGIADYLMDDAASILESHDTAAEALDEKIDGKLIAESVLVAEYLYRTVEIESGKRVKRQRKDIRAKVAAHLKGRER